MIEKMKKFTFLVTDREYEGFIDAIRELGIVHVTQLQQGVTSPQLQDAISMEHRYRAALTLLLKVGKDYASLPVIKAQPASSPLELLQRVENLQCRENELLHEEDELQKNLSKLEHWGNFEPMELERLSEQIGMQVHFFCCSTKNFKKEWVDELYATPISEFKKRTYFITFSAETPNIQAEHIILPQKSYAQIKEDISRVKGALIDVRQQLVAINAEQRHILEQGQVEQLNEMSLSKVHLSGERTCGDVLHLILGWVRADSTDGLVKYLGETGIFYEMEDPAFEDDVPVQITNGRFSRLFEPILKMYSLPNYNDLDPTAFFAPFFMLFFGLCMGDAGYGLLILLVGSIMTFTATKENQQYGKLAMWLGASTIVCGLATATVFGIDLSSQDWSFIQPFKPYFLNDNGVGPIFGYTPMMVLSVIIGLVQVILGMILKGCKAARNYGWPYAVGTFSWVLALLCAIAIYGLPICGVELVPWVQYALWGVVAVSALGIFLYNNPSSYKRPVFGLLSNIGGGVWESYGMATGLLGDLLSYIRLFALGLTGGVLGGVFNSLAYDMTSGLSLPMRILVMVIILLLGHGITFVLSMISAFVHPMRLTFVEFFKNADFTGGAKAYDPFREIKSNK